MFTGLIESHPVYRGILNELLELGSTRGGGVSVAGAPMLISALRRDVKQPILVITTDTETAENIAEALPSFNATDFCLFPPYGIIPFEPLSPDHFILGERAKTLVRIAGGSSTVASVSAVMRRLPPPDDILTNSIELVVGGEYDLKALTERLVFLGYRRENMVEGPGQFARRGGILDIFPASTKEPIRAEFFGDNIDGIRLFDVFTQRRTSEIERAVIIPCAEILIDEGRKENGLAKIRKRCGAEMEEKVRDAIDVFGGFEGIENLLPFFAPESSTILDYYPKPPLIIIVDNASVISTANAKMDETRRLAESARGSFPSVDAGELFVELDTLVSGNLGRGGKTLELVDTLSDIGSGSSLNLQPATVIAGELGDFASEVRRLRKKKIEAVVLCERPQQIDTFRDIMETKYPGFEAQYSVGWIQQGFIAADLGYAFFPAQAVLSRRGVRRPAKKTKRFARTEDTIKVGSIFDLKPGELIVHVEHGIGRFVGLAELPVNGLNEEFMEIEYADNNKLFLPVYNLRLVQKYVGGKEKARLDKLGGITWRKARKKANEAAEKLARQLLAVYAAREAHLGFSFAYNPDWENELADAFPFVETEDQMEAIAGVNRDMSSERAMDRLICGDVGFGKTEVAVRAALRAAGDGKQTAVLVPTTILAQQHFATFSERLAEFPVNVEVISRFKSQSEQKDIVKRIKDGSIDVIIGTHRLLSKDIEFFDLGLLVIDEEQRFGVKHKEKMKTLSRGVDVLTLTATPIPRTLYMALSGIRDISTISTPPIDRLPITTYVAPFDEDLIVEAINRELGRGGQVYFVHNRVQSIEAMAEYLRELLPGVGFAVAHGQMEERELEKVMVSFQAKNIDVLVSSSIIESGLDIPNVNTIIVNRADTFGLSQLHQLRGRVGRSHEQAYAYLLTPSTTALTDTARQRLLAVKEASELGSGYRLAMRDLEIRGAGNLLGAEQSGHVAAVGLDMYMKLLAAAVSRLKGKQPPADEEEFTITVSFDASLPRDYISDERQRLNLYRRISEVYDESGLADMRAELLDRFGRLPEAAENLLRLQSVRIISTGLPIRGITVKRNTINLEFKDDADINPGTFPGFDFIEDVEVKTISSGKALRVRLTIDPKKDILEAVLSIVIGLKEANKG